MKVLKFGGTSVGSVESILNVKQIVSSRKESVIVVVSALGGVTDMLLMTSSQAEKGDEGFRDSFEAIRKRHLDMVESIFEASDPRKAKLVADIEARHSELKSLYEGVYTLKVLPEKTKCQIVSFGERISSMIVSTLIDGAVLYDSLKFIKSVAIEGKNALDSEITDRLVKEAFAGIESRSEVAVVPGFISTDSSNGNITNLGRGGSDYTASIIAASLDAECLEIWTDVDGFMTADPRIIKTSYVIDELSFSDAMELCNFGAKVIYPPAIYPVCAKDIPVLIKNTFNPSAKGTVIRQNSQSAKTVTGISSINDTCLITVAGTSMAGIIGVNSRIFRVLADNCISVFLVSQSSSETHISLGISDKQADLACKVLDNEFAHEIAEGSMAPVQLMRDLATVAIVGEKMKSNAGIAGKLFSVLGRNGISIIAAAQGTEERNISFVVDKKFLRKSLNVIHDSFFLSEYQELNVFICGIGTVGGNLIEQIAGQQKKLMKENNLKINIVGIARRSKGVFTRDGIDLSTWRAALDEGKAIDLQTLKDEVIGMNIFNSVFVDCTASAEVATLYKDFFEHGISVVAANKVAASSDYENYAALKALALKRNVKFLFETNVGAGLPVINTINALKHSGDKILKIEAVVSGTLNFIFNTLSEDIPFSQTVRMAKEQGFSEPDPRVDLSGTDVVRKLVILAREAGYKVSQSDVKCENLIPASFFECSIDEFWEKLPSLDADFEKRRKEIAAQDKHWRVVARMENGEYTVSLCAFDRSTSFYNLEGSNNIILLTTERYNKHPMLIQGYGAGASVTAAGVFADIMSIANV